MSIIDAFFLFLISIPASIGMLICYVSVVLIALLPLIVTILLCVKGIASCSRDGPDKYYKVSISDYDDYKSWVMHKDRIYK